MKLDQLWSPQESPASRDARGRILQLGKTKVQYFYMAVRVEHNVGGFDIAMHDVCGMGCRKSLRHLFGNYQGAARIHSP